MKKTLIFIIGIFSIIATTFPQIQYKDEKNVSVTVQGWGNKVGDTKMSAMQTGVETVVLDMLSTPEENVNFQEQKETFLAAADKYVFDYSIKRKILEKGIHNGKKYKMSMTLELLINKEELRKELENRAIIQAAKEVRKQLDNFTIMPYVDAQKSSIAFSIRKDMVYAKIGSFLQNQHIPFIGEEEIKNIEDNEEMIALEKSTSTNSGEEDLLLQLARNTRADFYIKVVGHVDETSVEGVPCFKVSISISVYTVMTAENIASQTGYSRPLSLSSEDASISAGIEEAVNGSMPDIMNKLFLFWKDYIKEGRPYKLVFYDYDFNEFAKIRLVLNEMAPQVKLLMKASNITSFLVWFTGPLDELLFEVPGRIELNLKEDPTILGNTLRFFRKAR
ncbi:MAG: hypothetical protein QG657_3768 [Acidobacteriota bacterium]|nr:hypothetical protein [Acidobacteriota bacterium]